MPKGRLVAFETTLHTPILLALGAITTFGSTFSYFPDAIQPRFGYGMLLQWLQKAAPGLHPCGQMEEGSRAAELPSEGSEAAWPG